MIRLYPEQLVAQLREGLLASYLLFGNEPLLLQESQDAIYHAARLEGFTENFSFTLDNHTEWNNIFSLCQTLSLFARRQSILLLLPDNGPTGAMGEQLVKLTNLLHKDVLLILRGVKLTKAQENSPWFKATSQNSAYVSCQIPEQAQLSRWVAKRAKNLNLNLDEPANQLLCYCYEGNLVALSQALERLALLHPDSKLSLLRVEQAVNNEAHFTPWHWLDAILAGRSKRAWHILRQLQLADNEPVILLRSIQSELLVLLKLKRCMAQTPLRALFDQQKIWQNRRNLLTQALERLSMQQFQQALHLLTQMEIRLKQNYGQSIWSELESLSMLICGKMLPEIFFDAK